MYIPPMPSECKNFIYYKPINLACYLLVCKIDNKIIFYYIDKISKEKSTIQCPSLNKTKSQYIDDGDGDMETCWYDEYLDEEFCIA